MDRRFVVAAGCIVAAVVLARASGAQTGVLSGVILDETNKYGLQGVQVAIKGTDLVGVTGRDGRFTITGVPAGARQIEAWRAGYRNFNLSVLKVAANDTARVTVALAASPAENGVVAFDDFHFGYELKDVVGDVTGFDFYLDGMTGVVKGRIAGDLMADGISPNAPIYVIDDFVLERPVFSPRIPPDDIESVEVIKGAAAAALYGSKAANGVIVLKTKR